MNFFALAAGMMTVLLLLGACQRPRPAVLVAAILWPLYAVYEYLVATGVLCDANCNIRVDLVLFFPILAVATFYAYRSYEGLPTSLMPVGIVLGVIGLFVVGLLAEPYIGDFALVGVLGAVVIGVYFLKTRPVTSRS